MFMFNTVISYLNTMQLTVMYFVLLTSNSFSYFQLWRPFTSLFFYPIGPATGFHFLIMVYALYKYSSRLETGK